ncbi:helix-turn-helix domain-containing protein [Cryptosporangium phraense]|uniref:Helix-turn-helix domain-containing protein n=1 Tax=Cryptosporangium phraense TaxID=2593070 RepID=A0A545AR00_9ACTN|nr:helix-turn-helix domain-containing protein [Cryptosporangium phraense]TQS43748.1 helix-turn-helix domain-containing protein [Cryptosporangium phraense]
MDLEALPGPAVDAPEAGDDLVLTVEEAAARLRVGRTTMYGLIASGAVETVTIGRLRRVPTASLHTYVEGLRTRGEAA